MTEGESLYFVNHGRAYTEDDLRKIEQMLCDGLTYGQIAEKIERSMNSVKTLVFHAGGKERFSADELIRLKNTVDERRNEGIHNYWEMVQKEKEKHPLKTPRATNLSFEDRNQIEKLISQGFSNSEIGRMIGRSKNTIRNELRKLGGKRSLYKAEESEKFAQTAKKRRLEALDRYHASLPPRSPKERQRFRSKDMNTEINALKMQLELLYEMLENKKENNG